MRRQTERRIPLIRQFHHYVYDAMEEILTVSAADRDAFGFFRLVERLLGKETPHRFLDVQKKGFLQRLFGGRE